MVDINTENEGKSIDSLNFIEEIISADIKNNKNDSRVHTRFPPEPNGYLHIGHAKSICLNFGLGIRFNGLTNLRFDDTNPVKEDTEYVDSIKEDVKWLGFDWNGGQYYASDYFDRLYNWAELLIKKSKAYVCDMTAEEMSSSRGTPTLPGKESIYRSRSVEENLDLFRRMRSGDFADGTKTLRARIDMASPNMHMRDPVMYRIIHTEHHNTGNKWCIYPMYDYAHGQSDYIEGITHSICTLEFEVHRPLYDWYLDNILEQPDAYRPRQIEFARLNLTYTVMSKRKLLELVKGNYVSGWDDPRLPTICGLRRRGYTPNSIREFADRVGVAKRENTIDVALLEFCIREDLNKKAHRAMVVINPIKLIIDNYPEDKIEYLEAINNPEDPSFGKRDVPFAKVLYIENDDFMEIPAKKYFRLSPGSEVRLRYGYFVTCQSVEKDSNGNIIAVHCTYDEQTKGGNAPDGRKVKGTIHWVAANTATRAEVRLYERLFTVENPEDVEDGKDYKENINANSLSIISAYCEPSLINAVKGQKYQFERIGYFNVDDDSSESKLVFNRTVGLKETKII